VVEIYESFKNEILLSDKYLQCNKGTKLKVKP